MPFSNEINNFLTELLLYFLLIKIIYIAIVLIAPAANCLTEGSNSSRHLTKGFNAPASTTLFANEVECLATTLKTTDAAFL